jgi:hypothetical protein
LSHSQLWSGKVSITDEDIDYLTNLLLERETPLTLQELALALVENDLSQDAKTARNRFKNVEVYRPSQSYTAGQKLLFVQQANTIGTVVALREGNNPAYGEFHVIEVTFDDDTPPQEYAAALSIPHKLSDIDPTSVLMPGEAESNPQEVLAQNRASILGELEKKLKASGELVVLTNRWFPRSLILEANIGHLNLAEAVLDLNDGGPMTADEILEEIGGIGNAPPALQEFSLNHAMSRDNRFDEVGPTGQVLWYLMRAEPNEVRTSPPALHYTPIDYDPTLLAVEMRELEIEIDDEFSSIEIDEDEELDEATIPLIYPHRRNGTFPLNAKMRRIFPSALRTPRVWVTIVDGQDGEESAGWVVREERYVFGLGRFYRKHKLPVGAYITVNQDEDDPGYIILDFNSYKPRTEYIKLITPRNGQLAFEEQKRAIGAEYDSLMVLGTDEIATVDALAEATRQQRKPLASIIRAIITEIGRVSPQGTVHAKTIYSAVNVLRRCPPGPILATLISNPDFEYVGGLYWKLSEK